MWKRISAFLFDAIMMFIAAVGFVFLLSLAVGFDGYVEQYNSRREVFEEMHGVSLEINSEEEYNALSDTERAAFDKAYAEFTADGEANYSFTMMFQLAIITITFGILAAFLILEFAIPLLFKNGQTLGKKIFGIGIMRLDGVKVTAPFMFIRTILGKYTIETMVPILLFIMIIFGTVGLMGPVIILLILVMNLGMIIATRTRSPIHDMLANTVAIDFASQMIFDTPEALLEYKQRIHAEMAEKKEY